MPREYTAIDIKTKTENAPTDFMLQNPDFVLDKAHMHEHKNEEDIISNIRGGNNTYMLNKSPLIRYASIKTHEVKPKENPLRAINKKAMYLPIFVNANKYMGRKIKMVSFMSSISICFEVDSSKTNELIYVFMYVINSDNLSSFIIYTIKNPDNIPRVNKKSDNMYLSALIMK